MLSGLQRRAPPPDALARVKGWTRRRFSLGEDAPVFVAEIACSLPGCPPVETVVAFWTDGDRRHHFKLFKPAGAVTEEDLPPRWMKDALAESEMPGCECC
jgi:nitrate reductase delta subunit